MENQRRGTKKLWKPPSFEDFYVEPSQCKRIKLDDVEMKSIKEEAPDEVMEPKSIEELATHPKKIEELKNWFHMNGGRKAPMLLISGPAGSAKTTTLKVVASALNFSLREWINPVDKLDFQVEGCVPDKCDFTETRQIDKFEDFIFRASRYRSLFEDSDKTVILVEDFPNIFVWKSKLFYEFLERYQKEGRSPIVFICTDDQSLNLYNDLFPSAVKVKNNISEIKFNPVNQSSLMKTLKKAASRPGEKQSVSADVLQGIAQSSSGDLRNAISSLQILMTASKGRKMKPHPVSVKDSNTEFYQALGRVLYPKTVKTEVVAQNPNRIFLHDVLEMEDSFSDSFLMLLHENYINTYSNMDSVTKAADVFSFSDLYRDAKEYQSLIACIGLMTHNKQPKREGFKPIKKSALPYTSEKDIWMKRFEYSSYYATYRTLNQDLIPYLKVVSSCQQIERGVCEENEVEIEEFEDE